MLQQRKLQQALQAARSQPSFQAVWREHEQQRARLHAKLGLPVHHERNLRTRNVSPDDRDLREASSGRLQVSNCNNILYTTNIKLGNQEIPVLIDSGSSDLWVQSSKCDASCQDNRNYDQSRSTTFEPVEATESDFEIEYLDGTRVVGEHGYETLQLGDVTIPHQVFAQATSIYNSTKMCDELGLIGLGFGDVSSHAFPALLSNLKTSLDYPMFSLYLNAYNDYELYKNETVDMELPVTGRAPVSKSSELVFGGVNASRYSGCLHWHDLGQFRAKGETFKGYWDFALEKVVVGDTEITSSKLALIDSGSTILAGSSESVGHIAKLLDMVCAVFMESTQDIDLVECDNPFGFDMAFTDCTTTLQPIVFQADGIPYELDANDMLREIDTGLMPVCMLDLFGVPGFPGWLLGMNFLRRYYTVFDFGDKRLGFADASEYDDSICPDDAYLNVNSQPDMSLDTLTPTATPTAQVNEKSNPTVPAEVLSGSKSVPPPVDTPSTTNSIAAFAAILLVVAAVAFWLGRRHPRSHRQYEPANDLQACDSEDTEATETSDVEMSEL